jgi:hypothetical protein
LASSIAWLLGRPDFARRSMPSKARAAAQMHVGRAHGELPRGHASSTARTS